MCLMLLPVGGVVDVVDVFVDLAYADGVIDIAGVGGIGGVPLWTVLLLTMWRLPASLMVLVLVMWSMLLMSDAVDVVGGAGFVDVVDVADVLLMLCWCC